jgi:hypothetical protein
MTTQIRPVNLIDEAIMLKLNRFFALQVCVVALASGLMGAAPTIAQTVFSNASLQGSYGMQCRGFDKPGEFLVAHRTVAIQNYDGAGGVRNTSFYAVSGDIASNAMYSGMYRVNPDGTGNVQLAPTGETYDLVLSQGGKEANWVNTSFASVKRNMACTVKKVGTVNSVVGSYAWTGDGYYDRALNQRVSFTGRLVLDRSGTVTGSYTKAVNGTFSRSVAVTGTYSLANDRKTGVMSIRDQLGLTDQMFFVPVEDGKEIFLVSTKAGNTIGSHLTKQ